MGIKRELAGLGERMGILGIKPPPALACGRIDRLEFKEILATAIRIGEPGTRVLDITQRLAGLGERNDGQGISQRLALARGRKVSPAEQPWSSRLKWPGSASARGRWASAAIWRLACGRTAPMGFKRSLATAIGMDEPGTVLLVIRAAAAGLGERKRFLGITSSMALASCGRNAILASIRILATAIGIGEPGKGHAGFMVLLAGLGERNIVMGINGEVALACGRRRRLGFTMLVATAIGIGEPGTTALGINKFLAGLGERRLTMGITAALALACGRTALVGFTSLLATAITDLTPRIRA